MIKIILTGCCGYMGRVLTDMVNNNDEFTVVAGVDIKDGTHCNYPVFKLPCEIKNEITKNAEVIVDFSSPEALDGLLEYSMTNKLPIILCATGYTAQQITEIEAASKTVPVFRSGNMSVGINLLADLIKRACAVLGEDYDIEIVERHHRRKVDAPSGTALMLADAASESLPYETEYIYERESKRQPRKKQEIGISAIRGGTTVGTHDIIFAGQDETIELRHTATSRDIFAAGALKAAKYIRNASPALYNMTDVLK